MESDKEDATPGGDDVWFDDPEAHLEWATKLPAPQAQATNPLTQLQTETLTYMITHPEELYAEVRSKLQHWTTRKEELAQVNTMYRENWILHCKVRLVNWTSSY